MVEHGEAVAGPIGEPVGGNPSHSRRRMVAGVAGAVVAGVAGGALGRPGVAAADVPPGSVNAGSLAPDVFGHEAGRVARGVRQPISLADFGATGAGDESSKIQQALTYGAANRRPVTLEPGTTYTARNLSVPTGSHLVGARGAKLRLADGVAVGASLLLLPANTSDVIIEDLHLDGNRAGNPNRASTLSVRGGGTDLLFRNLFIEQSPQFGIGIDGGARRVEIASCTVLGSAYSAIIFTLYNGQNVEFCSVHDCMVDGVGNGHHGIGAFASSTAGMIDCTFQGNVLKNIDHDAITGYSRHNRRVLCSGNIADNTGFTPGSGGGGGHFCHFGGTDITVTDNIITNWDGVAIFLRNHPNGPLQDPGFGFVVADNIVNVTVGSLADNGEGIQVEDYNRGTISGNEVNGTRVTGISVGGNMTQTESAGHITISGNLVADAGRDGIGVLAGFDVAVTGNVVTGAARHGIWLYRSQKVAVTGNVIDGCGTTGVHISDGGANPSTDLLVADNVIADAPAGIRSVEGTARVTTSANVFASIAGPTVELVGTDNTVLDRPAHAQLGSRTTGLPGASATSWTTVASFPVAAGEVGPGDLLVLTAGGRTVNDSGASRNLAVAITVAGTEALLGSFPIGAGSHLWRLVVEILVGATVDEQRISASFTASVSTAQNFRQDEVTATAMASYPTASVPPTVIGMGAAHDVVFRLRHNFTGASFLTTPEFAQLRVSRA